MKSHTDIIQFFDISSPLFNKNKILFLKYYTLNYQNSNHLKNIILIYAKFKKFNCKWRNTKLALHKPEKIKQNEYSLKKYQDDKSTKDTN